MPKSPAYSMYAKEWLASEAVALMPPEAEGLFIRLLNLSWDNEGLPTDPEAVKDLVGRKYARVWRSAWPPVRRQFIERNGRLVNKRQEDERDKQAERRAKRIKAAETRWEGERKAASAPLVHTPVHVQEPDLLDPVVHGLAFAVASTSAGTATTSVPNGTGPTPAVDNAEPEKPPTWDNAGAAKTIRELCYQPDGQEPAGGTIGEDLRWWKRLEAAGQSPARITCALYGLPLIMRTGGKWSPARVFGKRGDWIDLFERAVTADGKSHRPRTLGGLMQQMATPSLRKANT